MPDDALLNLTVSISAARAHDELCDQLERGWIEGQPPRVEDLLAQVAPDQQRDLFIALLRVEFSYRPAPFPVGEYQLRFPQFAILVDRVQHDPAGDTGDFPPAMTTVLELPSIDGLEILGMIAAGGMGIVYRAWEVAKERSVAVKTMKSSVSKSPDFLKRFQREAWAVAQLSHRGVVQLYSFGDRDGVPHFVMEFVEGGSLDHRLDGNPKDPGWSADLVEQLARTMQYVHDRDIVHRDLKPANILMASEQSEDYQGDEKVLIPKIADFGLAKRITDPETGITIFGTVLGSASYMAPEQAAGLDEVGKPADIYGLGAILFELLTGRPPFRAATRDLTVEMVRNDDPPYPTDLNPAIPSDLETICLRCLEKEPKQRYLSAADLAEDLQRWSEGRPILAPPFRGPDRDAKWAQRIGYEITGFLGTTGGSAIYAAVQKSIERRVVLKLSAGRAGSRHHDALKREATFLPTLDSPYVLRLIDYGERYGQPYLVLDHVEGGVLLSRMLRDDLLAGSIRKPLMPRRAAEICLMIAVGVQNLHDHGVLHGCLHSGCVLLSREMIAKLIGFETARRLDEPIVGEFMSLPKGVPAAFVAPELLDGHAERVGRATDVYGVGAILYDSLTGRPPFLGTSIEEVRERVLHSLPIAPRQVESSVPIALEAICLRALNKDPAKRYATIGAIALELQRFLKPSGSSDDSTVGSTDAVPPHKLGPAEAYQLRILSGPTKVGESFALSTQQFKLGRSRDCQIVLAGNKISHLHCGIVWNDRHEIVDSGSKNGTFVNGELVNSNRPLSPGDLIQLPTYVLQYETSAG